VKIKTVGKPDEYSEMKALCQILLDTVPRVTVKEEQQFDSSLGPAAAGSLFAQTQAMGVETKVVNREALNFFKSKVLNALEKVRSPKTDKPSKKSKRERGLVSLTKVSKAFQGKPLG